MKLWQISICFAQECETRLLAKAIQPWLLVCIIVVVVYRNWVLKVKYKAK